MFVVSAWRKGEPVRDRRVQKASAAVLAMRLVGEGCTEVTITDEKGAPLDIEAFRRKHLPPLNGPRRALLA